MNTQEIMDMWERQAQLVGQQRGELLGQRQTILRLLRRKFGEVPREVVARVESAEAATLDRFADKLLFASSAEEVIADEP